MVIVERTPGLLTSKEPWKHAFSMLGLGEHMLFEGSPHSSDSNLALKEPEKIRVVWLLTQIQIEVVFARNGFHDIVIDWKSWSLVC